MNENCPDPKQVSPLAPKTDVKSPKAIAPIVAATPLKQGFSDEQNGAMAVKSADITKSNLKPSADNVEEVSSKADTNYADDDEAAKSTLLGGGFLALLTTKEAAAVATGVVALAKTASSGDPQASQEDSNKPQPGATQEIVRAVEESNKGTVLDNPTFNILKDNSVNIVNEVSQIIELPGSLPNLLGKDIPTDNAGISGKVGATVDDLVLGGQPVVEPVLSQVDNIVQLDKEGSTLNKLTSSVEDLLASPGDTVGISSLGSVLDLSVVNNNLKVSE